jgi:Caspase domain/Outer membrane protein beta-barrel domain
MKWLFAACASLAALASLPEPALCAGVVQRYLLVAGANYGGMDRPRLLYAVSDAERFARVLVELGGVAPANAIVLKEPKLREFLQALDLLSARVAEGQRGAAGSGGGRTEVLLYYSGHADEKGLLLGEDRYSYRSLRDRLDQIPADVRIAVLDACASGAFIRIKGGKTRPAFLVDESSSMRGHAFLTSSAETEAAQESDRIGASYFTHYLVSGLRGAADSSGDGKVTLNEAYQFAFNETLGRTEQTKGGAQHPSYDITMSGSGDVVMTDLRQTSATLALGEELAGRFFVRNAAQQLVVELYKPAGRKVELGLEPGAYEVRLERGQALLAARTQVAEGGRVVLDGTQFRLTTPEATRRRGIETPSFAVAGRNRIEARLRMPSSAGGAGLEYARYVREDVAVTLGLDASHGTSTLAGTSTILALPVGVRWNPMKGDLSHRALKPYLAAGIGPVFGSFTGSTVAGGLVFTGSSATTFEAQLGVGADIHVAHSWSVGLAGTYNWMGDFPESVGGRRSYGRGFQLGVGIGWLFGRGYGPR